MSYARNDAIDFADKNWNTPAGGSFWLSDQEVVIEDVRRMNVLRAPYWKKAPLADGWMPFFVDDGARGEKAVFQRVVGGTTEEILINPWAGIADCAHFLSKCLTAGGARVSELAVPALVAHLQGRHDTKTLCEQVSQVEGQRIVDSGIFKPGDMIGYFNIDPKGDYGGKREYSHSTMFAGKTGSRKEGAVTCHTICRFPGRSWVEDRWWLKDPGHYLYTFIHFSDDDTMLYPAKAEAVAGWWKLEYSGRTEYYLMQKGGSVRYTKQAPSKGQTSVQAPEGSAYWFMAINGEITFTWRKSGTIEVWTPTASGYSSMINGSVPGVLTKLF